MAQPQRKKVYEDEAEQPLSAVDRSKQRWGMEPEQQETSGQDNSDDVGEAAEQSPTPARERANSTWGMGGSLAEGENAETSDGIGDVGANAAEGNLSNPPEIPTTLTPEKKGLNKALLRVRGLTLSRKNGLRIGGGMGAAGLIFTAYFAGASLFLVHLKNLLLGKTNEYNNSVSVKLQGRRVRSAVKILRKGSQKIRSDAFISKARAAGFEVGVKGSAITSMKYGDKVVDFTKSDTDVARTLKSFENAGDEAGRAFVSAFDDLATETSARFSGIVTRRTVFRRLGIVRLFDWIGLRVNTRAGPDDVVNPKAAFGDALRSVDETQRGVLQFLDDDLILRELGFDPATVNPDDVDNLLKNADNDAKDYLKALNEATGQDVLKTAQESSSREVIEATDELAAAFSATDDATSKKLFSSFSGKLASGSLKSNALKALELFGPDPTSVLRGGCRLVGTLDFVKSARNMLMAAELAKFAVRFYTIADHQQAGLANSTSIKLMSIYLAGATGSSGVQSIVAGTAVSSLGVAKYGTGYADVGVLAAISAFARKIPGLEPSSCKIVSNPLTSVAGNVVGGAAAVLTAGTSYETTKGLSFWQSLGLTIGTEVAYSVATPIIIGAVGGALLSGFENPEEAGSALASGTGSSLGMMNNANSVLPATNSVYSSAKADSRMYRQDELKSQSFAERYFDFNNSDSLLARASLYSPQSLPALSNIAKSSLSFDSFNPLSTIFSFTGRAQAAGSCADEAAQKYDIACDGFGNPIFAYVPPIDLDNTERVMREFVDENGKLTPQIDGAGQPIKGSEFEKFIENCFSGRTGVLHPVEVNTNGSSDPNDPTCVVGVEDRQIAGDIPEVFPGSTVLDNRNWFAKMLSPRASAQSADIERTPTKKERFAAWNGYLVDEENLTSQINDEYLDISSSESNLGGANISGDAVKVGDYKGLNIQSDQATGCPGIEQVGAKTIQRYVNDTWGGGTGYITSCRSVSTGSGAKSIHSEGRAVDSFFNATSPDGLQKGNEAFGWLLANAENIGVQYIKFWRVQWSAGRGVTCVGSKNDQGVHSDHIHYELNWPGARQETPYFSSGAVSSSIVKIDQEICPVL